MDLQWRDFKTVLLTNYYMQFQHTKAANNVLRGFIESTTIKEEKLSWKPCSSKDTNKKTKCYTIGKVLGWPIFWISSMCEQMPATFSKKKKKLPLLQVSCKAPLVDYTLELLSLKPDNQFSPNVSTVQRWITEHTSERLRWLWMWNKIWGRELAQHWDQ